MENFYTGCLLCGKPLKYQNENKTYTCQMCSKNFESNVSCEDEHFVCDACHAEKGVLHITAVALSSKSKNPIEIATEMMKSPHISMHGPEHHYLVPAALLAACHNAGGTFNLSRALGQARQRTRNVPGGICGMWGSCGAGVGAGIFTSIITGATPLATDSWSLANLATSKCLCEISKNGGPRCCKRNTFLAITEMIPLIKQHFGFNLESQDSIKCSFFKDNHECRGLACLYFPKHS